MSNITKNILGMPTVRHNPTFSAKQTAELLHKAMEGKGTNKDQIIQALCTISNQQRQETIQQYKTEFGKDLVAELKKELSGDFEGLIVALMTPPAIFDAQQMHKAMAGLGTKESVLIEIMMTHSNRQLTELKRAYEAEFGKSLEKDIVGDTSGAFQRLLVSILNGARDESWAADPVKAGQQARLLYKEGEGKKGVNDAAFNQVMANENFSQLHLIFDEYQKITGHSIEQALQHEFSGDNKDGFLAVVECVRNRAAFFAKQLHGTMKGLGTRDSDLIRLVVSRSECDLSDIKEQYLKLYGKSLEKDIDGDCSGAYKQGLLALVRGN
jgi:annexin A7/11